MFIVKDVSINVDFMEVNNRNIFLSCFWIYIYPKIYYIFLHRQVVLGLSGSLELPRSNLVPDTGDKIEMYRPTVVFEKAVIIYSKMHALIREAPYEKNEFIHCFCPSFYMHFLNTS